MINCCVLFSLMITTNSKSLFVHCLFVRMVSLFLSVLYIMTVSTANLCFILALKCPFDLHFEYHNFLTTISTRAVKAGFEKSLKFSFFA